MKIGIALMLLTLLSWAQPIWAQESNEHHGEKHQVALMLGHVYVPKAVDLVEGPSSGVALPIWSLAYNYRIKSNWVIGIHTDITVQSFEVESSSDEVFIERSFPIAPALMVGHSIFKHGILLFGGGYEIEKHKSFPLARIGAEWGYPLFRQIEVSGALEYDYRFDAYDSFSLMFGISYLW